MGAVARIVRHEHEHWDGGGYPDGLAATRSRSAAAIILACDAYNAMTTDRPYREAMPHADGHRRAGALRRARSSTRGDRGADRLPLLDGAGAGAARLSAGGATPAARRSSPTQRTPSRGRRAPRAATSRWSSHQSASAWTAPESICACICERPRVVRRRPVVGRPPAISAAMTPVAWACTRSIEVADLRVGRVAEQRAPRVAVLLDEGQERVDAAAQPLLARRARLRRWPAAGGRSRRRAPRAAGVQRALGREVLVDQRLGDPGRLGDLVQRGAVVAAARRRPPRRRRGLLAALRRPASAAAGRRHARMPRAMARAPRLDRAMATVDFAAEGLLDGLDDDARAAPRGAARACSSAEGVARRGPARARPRRRPPVFLLAERAGRRRAALHRRARSPSAPALSLELLPRCAAPTACRCPTPTHARSPTTDLEAARSRAPFARARASPTEQMLDVVARARAAAWRQSAEAMRSIVLELVLSPGATELELARRYAGAVARLLPLRRPDARADAAHAPAPDGAHRGDQRRRARGGRAARRARDGGRLRRPRRLHAPGRGGRRPTSSARVADRLAELAGDVARPARAARQDDRRRRDARLARGRRRCSTRSLDLVERRRRRGRGLPAAARRRRLRPGAQPRAATGSGAR